MVHIHSTAILSQRQRLRQLHLSSQPVPHLSHTTHLGIWTGLESSTDWAYASTHVLRGPNYHYTTTLIDGELATENSYLRRRFELPFFANILIIPIPYAEVPYCSTVKYLSKAWLQTLFIYTA